jgi:hypothetical protein
MSKDSPKRTLKELIADPEVTLAAFKKARDSAIRLHRAYNVPMAISQNGEVVKVSPFDLQTEEERALQK